MKRGTRIELRYISDPHTELKPGALGTVTMIDALGTIHVAWDSGSTLGLIPGEDRWAEAEAEEEGTTTWPETIYECKACGYKTNDTHTAGVINDLTGECPTCGADAALDKAGLWLKDPAWYGQ